MFTKNAEKVVISISSLVSILAFLYYAKQHAILAYGDAESHIDIAKRVVSGITPGLGQLGGVWLPLQHIFMLPFVMNDFMWRTGYGGSIVSMACFIGSSILLFKLLRITTSNLFAAYIGTGIFIFNPNILYLQVTPLGELALIFTVIASVYYFNVWILKNDFIYLIFSGFFICCGSLIRYDAWFFIACSFFLIPLIGIIKKMKYQKLESLMVMYYTVALLGIIFWLIWNYIIFRNPLYFLNSPYSAKAQQLEWLKRGQLPSYHNILSSILFYTYDVIDNVGWVVFLLACVSLFVYAYHLFKKKNWHSLSLILLFSPYLFYIITLFLGISIILIPELVPATYISKIFNVRYGVMMIPFIALIIGILAAYVNTFTRFLLLTAIVYQVIYYMYAGNPIVLEDGLNGLSGNKPSPTNIYIANHYDYGLIMFDDFSRTANPVALNVPMNRIIYVGNHPYWDESLQHPTRYIRWLIIRKDQNDALWYQFHANKEFLTNYHQVYVFAKTYVYKKN